MPDQTIPDYEGYQITLELPSCRFHVTGPLAPEYNTSFGSYHEATAAIDGWKKAAEKQARAAASFSAEMLDDWAKPVTIKGIHAGTGKVVGGGESKALYPTTPWVADLLRERLALNARLFKVRRALDAVGTISSRGHGRISAASYEGEIKSLETEIATKRALAEKGPPA